ncbi:acyltransferase family protein [Streptomyces sp. NPDC055089]
MTSPIGGEIPGPASERAVLTAPPAPERSAAPAPGRGGRDPFFDNAKFLLLVLVVCAHFWADWINHSDAVRSAAAWVYSFHMPAFIVLSGYLSRSYTGRPDQVKRLITGVLVPYLIFETLYALVRQYVLDEGEIYITILQPWFVCWFLVALFIWRITTPVWRAVRWPVAVAVVISMLSGLTSNGNILQFARVLQFLPFFVLGLQLRREHFEWLRSRNIRVVSAVVMCLALPFSYLAAPRLNDWEWFSWRHDYTELHVSLSFWFFMRIALFVAAAVMTAAFFSLVPNRRTWFTVMGTRTMYALLLHPLLYRAAVDAGVYDRLDSPWGKLALTAVAAVVAVVLMTAVVQRIFRPLVEPRVQRFMA